ncbi:MAG: polysaccharide biosynthesis tyrosine autokinase [Solirubrobacterales bacterium]|nr:polysaccharide biosynthesis tyrosine autokinase [Solirubrobacterales bacterium]
MQQDSEAPSLERILGVIRRRLPWIVLSVVIVAGAAYAVSKHQTKKYTTGSSLIFSENSLNQQIAGLSGGASTNSAGLLAQQANNLALVRGGDIAEKTALAIGRGVTPGRVFGSLSIGSQGETGIVSISATTTSPTLSAAIANTYADQFVKERQQADRLYFKSALALVHKQLAALSPQQRIGPDGLQLQNRAQALTLLTGLSHGDVQVAQQAYVPSSPSSPRTTRNTGLGLFLGLLIGVALAFIFDRLDRRVKGPEDLETIYGLPLLGVVPENAALARSVRDKKGRRSVLPPAEAEAFSLIAAHLRFLDGGRELRTIAIGSADPGDGKTTVARHLAEAIARLGSRVLLLEVDLRNPTVARHLDLQPGPGLSDVLSSGVAMSPAVQHVLLGDASADGAHARMLDVLAAGSFLPPNPAELLASQTMEAVLEQARSEYDLVVIDTPPLTTVSDAFPLLTKIDGVVIVGWVARSRRDAAERLHQVLAGSAVPLLGVVANGAKLGRSSSYTYASEGKPSPAVGSVNGAAPSGDLVPTAKA